MNAFPEFFAVAFGFLLRLGIPVGLSILIGWLLRRLDARWQAEAESELAQLQARTTPAPCWEVHHCPPGMRQRCPAYNQPNVPCWEHQRANGQLQAACLTCKVRRQFEKRPAAALVQPQTG